MPNFNSSGGAKKIIIAAAAIVAFGAVFVLSRLSDDILFKTLSPEEITARQMEELEMIRKKTPPLTQEEIDKQMEELDKIKSKI